MRELYDLVARGELRVVTRSEEERGQGPYLAATLLFRDGHVLELLQRDAARAPSALESHRRRVAERIAALHGQLGRLLATLNGAVAICLLWLAWLLAGADMRSEDALWGLLRRAALPILIALGARAARGALKRRLRAQLGVRLK